MIEKWSLPLTKLPYVHRPYLETNVDGNVSIIWHCPYHGAVALIILGHTYDQEFPHRIEKLIYGINIIPFQIPPKCYEGCKVTILVNAPNQPKLNFNIPTSPLLDTTLPITMSLGTIDIPPTPSKPMTLDVVIDAPCTLR
eukprot:NODE_10966_length_481_cov_21.810056_g10311_i0.p1 GENE.NODE_10966_length_481_cov_21.810056_g10311_i0~~NODE_10966_length_481_cov_21.810056_g10311_i0.p1  ORF type:complete len:159 (+),score=34.20 NODE_10966_length_481_cov_21.810056_g10311_i0:58-477(+)